MTEQEMFCCAVVKGNGPKVAWLHTTCHDYWARIETSATELAYLRAVATAAQEVTQCVNDDVRKYQGGGTVQDHRVHGGCLTRLQEALKKPMANCANPYCDGIGWITIEATATTNAYRVLACEAGPHPQAEA